MEKEEEKTSNPIILFDGVCNLCEGSVRFIIQRDPKEVFRFAPLQSPFGRSLLEKFRLPVHEITTLVLVEGDDFYERSAAALRIARRLKMPWPILSVFLALPKFIRDPVYNWIARNRYRWFGKKEACLVPTPELKERFLG